MRKITISDFGVEQSDRYAKLQKTTEAVWAAHYEASIVHHHVSVQVTTASFQDEYYRSLWSSSLGGHSYFFSEKIDMEHYRNPLRRPPSAYYVSPEEWKYFPPSWKVQYKMIDYSLVDWDTALQKLEKRLSDGSLSDCNCKQLNSLVAFTKKSLFIVRCSIEAICNRARFQGA